MSNLIKWVYKKNIVKKQGWGGKQNKIVRGNYIKEAKINTKTLIVEF